MSEFSLSEGKVSAGILSAVGGGLTYLLVPIIIVTFTSALITKAGVEEQLRAGEILSMVVIFGIPITILSFFRGFYPKGSRSRFIFGALTAALVCLWIWFVTLGGSIAVDMGQFGLALSFTGLVYLLIFAAALRGVYFLAEMVSYRREWLMTRQPVKGTTATQ